MQSVGQRGGGEKLKPEVQFSFRFCGGEEEEVEEEKKSFRHSPSPVSAMIKSKFPSVQNLQTTFPATVLVNHRGCFCNKPVDYVCPAVKNSLHYAAKFHTRCVVLSLSNIEQQEQALTEQIAIPAVLSELAERNKTVDGANSEARGKRRQWSTKEKKHILHGEKPST